MKRDSKLSGVLHILLHMAVADAPVTSEQLATIMQTNPVVVRRLLAGLRDAGHVSSENGRGGGWRIHCDLETTTLKDIYLAVGAPDLFAIGHRSQHPGCLVEKAVNAELGDALDKAQEQLLKRFSQVTLQQLLQQFRRSPKQCGHDG